MAWGRLYPLAYPNQGKRRGAGDTLREQQERLKVVGKKKGLGNQAHIGDKGPKALHDVGAVMTLEYHIQVHEDPLVLFLVPRASHLLYRTVRGGEEI